MAFSSDTRYAIGPTVPTDPASIDPMPVFVIKGKDALAVPAIEAYRRQCIEHGLDMQAASVERSIDEVKRWQSRNIDATKLPDHPHVPAGQPGSGSETRVVPTDPASIPPKPRLTMYDNLKGNTMTENIPNKQTLQFLYSDAAYFEAKKTIVHVITESGTLRAADIASAVLSNLRRVATSVHENEAFLRGERSSLTEHALFESWRAISAVTLNIEDTQAKTQRTEQLLYEELVRRGVFHRAD